MHVLALLVAIAIAASAQAFLPTTTAVPRRPTQTHMTFDVSAVDTFYQTQPYMAAFLTCSVKASAADLVAQKKSEQNDIDVSRNLAFLAYGGIWQGIFQQFLFTALYPLLFAGNSWDSILEQVVFDTSVMGPMVCLPIVYTVKNLFRTGNVSKETVLEALETYYDHVTTRGLLTTYWSIWIPAQFATFGFVPPHLRVLFVAAVSFFWVTKLSAISAVDQDQDATTTHTDWEKDFKVFTEAHKFN